MAGSIRCSKCEKKINGPVCSCGNTKCYIVIYWHGRHYKFRRYYQDGVPLHFERADRQLTVMRSQIDNKSFNPYNWLDSKIAERRFDMKTAEWLKDKEELAYLTYKDYQSYSTKYYIPFFGKFDVREISFEILEKFKDSLPLNLKISYKKIILRVLYSFFNWLKSKGVIKEIPQFPKIEGDDSVFKVSLEYEEQQEALKRIPESYRDPIELSMETGLRTGETCALKVKDIFLDKKYVVIQRTWSGKQLRETTKAENKKKIPLSDRAIEILKANMINKFPEDFIFKYKPITLATAWKKYSGLEVTLYEATRHSFCTQIVEMGTNVLQAQTLMRHTNIRMTEKYFHGNMTKLKDIVDKRSRIVPLSRSEFVPKIKNKLDK